MSDEELTRLIDLIYHEEEREQSKGWRGLMQLEDVDVIGLILDRKHWPNIKDTGYNLGCIDGLYDYISSFLDRDIEESEDSFDRIGLITELLYALDDETTVILLLDILFNSENSYLRQEIADEMFGLGGRIYLGCRHLDEINDIVKYIHEFRRILVSLNMSLYLPGITAAHFLEDAIVEGWHKDKSWPKGEKNLSTNLDSLIIMALEEDYTIDICWGFVFEETNIFQKHEDDGHYGFHYLVHPYGLPEGGVNIDRDALLGLANIDSMASNILDYTVQDTDWGERWYFGDS